MKIGKKMIMRLMLMWLNWSVATINATLQLLDIYKFVDYINDFKCWDEYYKVNLKLAADHVCIFLCGSRALFTGPASTFFSKNNFKTRSHGTIHTFKNYFTIIFSAICCRGVQGSRKTATTDWSRETALHL